MQTWEVLEGPGYMKQSAVIVEGDGKITYLRLKYLCGLTKQSIIIPGVPNPSANYYVSSHYRFLFVLNIYLFL